jgi:hypothetical protein
MQVFLLWHSHDLGDGETNDKLIGVYSSAEQAEAAKARKLQFEGFWGRPRRFSDLSIRGGSRRVV